MSSKKKKQTLDQHEALGLNHPVPDLDIDRLRAAYRHIEEAASRIPPLSPEQVHALISSGRLSQFQIRRQADRGLLVLCLLALTLAASLLWRTSPAGITPLNVTLLILAVADAWVALRAARSLWLMRQTLRLRHRPYRMLRYSDRLNRLSHRRRWWIDLVLRNSTNADPHHISRRQERLAIRVPSYVAAACVLLILAIHTNAAFAATRTYSIVTTTSNQTAAALCHSVNKIIEQL